MTTTIHTLLEENEVLQRKVADLENENTVLKARLVTKVEQLENEQIQTISAIVRHTVGLLHQIGMTGTQAEQLMQGEGE